MRKTILITGIAAIAFLASCSKSNSTEAAEAGEAASATTESVTYTVDPAASTVQWMGAKITETKHVGSVVIKEGTLSMTGSVLTSGKFVMDLTSITEINNDDVKSREMLNGHLKSAEFFDVEKYPMATLEIVEVVGNVIKANLTIKDVTKMIEIPSTIEVSETGLKAHSHFTINRNNWGITWGSAAQPIAFLKDNLVKEEVEFDINLVATK